MCDYQEIRKKGVNVRKARNCDWCWEKIEKGGPAQYRVYVFGGEFMTDWMHPECNKAMMEADHDMVCDGWMPGTFKRGSVDER